MSNPRTVYCFNKIFQLITNTNGAVTYYRIMVTEAERTENMQKIFILWSSSDESCRGGDVGLRETCKECIKRMSSAYLTDKERSTNVFCRMSNGCITDKTNMYRKCNE